ncbi:ORF1B [turkey adenovirus 5]|uniref:ORF1B n=1 Tax=turkey adenovirus 5 TaxID=1408258 RepID=U5NET4_9ADEN|nr:ORF1B [Turkey aviadenovirus 5]AGX93326.1 ORF1B [Turkey aviadenovirus 5]AGX93363.1 ORF1B [Turkey aviadenovirus 5]
MIVTVWHLAIWGWQFFDKLCGRYYRFRPYSERLLLMQSRLALERSLRRCLSEVAPPRTIEEE